MAMQSLVLLVFLIVALLAINCAYASATSEIDDGTKEKTTQESEAVTEEEPIPVPNATNANVDIPIDEDGVDVNVDNNHHETFNRPAIDVPNDGYVDLSYTVSEDRIPSPPVDVPCDILANGAALPFERTKTEIVRLLRDMSQSGTRRIGTGGKKAKLYEDEIPTTPRSFVCQPDALKELGKLVRNVGSHETLDLQSQRLKAMALNGFARLGNECAVDILTLSDHLHHWASEMSSLASAAHHASEDCSQAWAHFLAFIASSEHLPVPQFRSEQCTFLDEYRECFELKKADEAAEL